MAFLTFGRIPEGVLPSVRAERVRRIAQGLADSEIVSIDRRVVALKIAGVDEIIEGDVTQAGFTIYLGGFDWITYPVPPHVLQKFPQLLPLPQQALQSDEDEL